MLISSNLPVPGQLPARPTKVTEVAFDRGMDYYNDDNDGGRLKERPSQKGFIMLNKVTLEAADKKIEAIQNRVADLSEQGVKADAQGNFHYEDKSGEVVDIKKDGDTTVYSQSLPEHTSNWFVRDDATHIESFAVKGDEVRFAVTDKHDEFYNFFGLPLSKHETSQTTMSSTYRHTPEGLQYYHSDKWQLAQ